MCDAEIKGPCTYFQRLKLLFLIFFKPLQLENGERYDKKAFIHLVVFCRTSFRSFREVRKKVEMRNTSATDGTKTSVETVRSQQAPQS